MEVTRHHFMLSELPESTDEDYFKDLLLQVRQNH